MVAKFKTIHSLLKCFLLLIILFISLGESRFEEYPLEKNHGLELKPMFVVNDGESNERNLELKEFYDKYNSLCGKAGEKYDSLLKTVNNYIQRYDEEGNKSNDMITVQLEITISPEDLAYLQNFSKTSRESSVLKDLSRLDAILSKVARRRERSYFEHILRCLISLLYWLGMSIHRLFLLTNFYNFVPLLTILLVTWLVYRLSSRKSFYIYLSIIINSMIFWDSLTLYRRKIKDAEIEIENLKLQKLPAECDPESTRWYHSLMNIFVGDRCLEYYKKINRNPSDEVSLLQSIIDTYSFYTIQAAFRILGASLRDFTGEISALWPKPVRWIVGLPLVPFFTVLLGFFILICMKRVKLSFFGACVEIGNTTTIKETRIISKPGPRLIAGYRPLRILAKSRLFKNSEVDLAKEKKSSLKASNLKCKEDSDVRPPESRESEIAKKED